MLDTLFWFGCGLIVGWNLLPQPWYVKMAYDSIISMVKSWLTGNK